MTLSEAKEMLNLWINAEKAVSTGQSYSIGGRSLTRVDLKEIREAQQYWEGEIYKLENNIKSRGARVLRVIPRDL
jgi:hypothetical protein